MAVFSLTRGRERTLGHQFLVAFADGQDAWFFVSILSQPALQLRVELADPTAATGENDVFHQVADGVGGGPADGDFHQLEDFLEQPLADLADAVGEIEPPGFAANDDVGSDRSLGLAGVGIGLLDLANAWQRQIRVGVLPLDRFVQELVHLVAGKGGADLLVRAGIVALHQADVGGARADVHEQRVADRIEVGGIAEARFVPVAECRQERFRHEHDLVEQTAQRRAEVFPAGAVRAGRHADHGAKFGVGRGVHELADVAGEILRGVEVFDDAILHRRNHPQVNAILHRQLAVEDPGIAGQQVLDNPFAGVANDGRNNLVRDQLGRTGEGRLDAGRAGAKVEADEHDVALDRFGRGRRLRLGQDDGFALQVASGVACERRNVSGAHDFKSICSRPAVAIVAPSRREARPVCRAPGGECKQPLGPRRKKARRRKTGWAGRAAGTPAGVREAVDGPA